MIDIMRTSASRPDYLKTTTEALQKNLKYDGGFRWLIHEDSLHEEWSKQCTDYINEVGIYDVSKVNQTPIGQGPSLTWLLEQTNTPYILNVEDDYELIKPLDLNPLVDLMDKHPGINQIAFHKRRISWKRGNYFTKKQVVRDGVPLVTDPHWAFTPSLFRLSYLKPKWVSFADNVHWKMNEVLKGGRGMRDADWVIANTGTYWLGCIRHIDMLMKDHGFTKEEALNCDDGRYHFHLGTGDGSIRHGRYKG